MVLTFFIGHLRGRSGREVFPITESSRLYNGFRKSKETLHETELCLTAKGQSNWTGSFIKVRAVLTADRPEKRQNGRRFKEPGEPMFTLTSQDRHGVVIEDNANVVKTINTKDSNGKEPPQQNRVYDTFRLMTTLLLQLNGIYI